MSYDKMVLTVLTAFDNGELRQSPELAAKMMASLLATMRNEKPPIDRIPLVEIHDTVWERLVKVCLSLTTPRLLLIANWA